MLRLFPHHESESLVAINLSNTEAKVQENSSLGIVALKNQGGKPSNRRSLTRDTKAGRRPRNTRCTTNNETPLPSPSPSSSPSPSPSPSSSSSSSSSSLSSSSSSSSSSSRHSTPYSRL
uniref:Uncharacterized protein n=1 Tax=Vespula pensylvanica TaxID=30213 RepID=A0A834KM39_VESPE|nr:hypothetical protein H0235_014118 [Vespula pensylvanica]